MAESRTNEKFASRAAICEPSWGACAMAASIMQCTAFGSAWMAAWAIATAASGFDAIAARTIRLMSVQSPLVPRPAVALIARATICAAKAGRSLTPASTYAGRSRGLTWSAIEVNPRRKTLREAWAMSVAPPATTAAEISSTGAPKAEALQMRENNAAKMTLQEARRAREWNCCSFETEFFTGFQIATSEPTAVKRYRRGPARPVHRFRSQGAGRAFKEASKRWPASNASTTSCWPRALSAAAVTTRASVGHSATYPAWTVSVELPFVGTTTTIPPAHVTRVFRSSTLTRTTALAFAITRPWGVERMSSATPSAPRWKTSILPASNRQRAERFSTWSSVSLPSFRTIRVSISSALFSERWISAFGKQDISAVEFVADRRFVPGQRMESRPMGSKGLWDRSLISTAPSAFNTVPQTSCVTAPPHPLSRKPGATNARMADHPQTVEPPRTQVLNFGLSPKGG